MQDILEQSLGARDKILEVISEIAILSMELEEIADGDIKNRLSLRVFQYLEAGEEDDPAKDIGDRIKGKPRLCDYHGSESRNNF